MSEVACAKRHLPRYKGPVSVGDGLNDHAGTVGVSDPAGMLIVTNDIHDPAELGPTFLAAINAADLDGVVRCYDPDAVLGLANGSTVTRHEQIRAFYSELLATRPRFEPEPPAPVLVHGDTALTTTRIGETATAEVATAHRRELAVDSGPAGRPARTPAVSEVALPASTGHLSRPVPIYGRQLLRTRARRVESCSLDATGQRVAGAAPARHGPPVTAH